MYIFFSPFDTNKSERNIIHKTRLIMKEIAENRIIISPTRLYTCRWLEMCIISTRVLKYSITGFYCTFPADI
jgi:hypothetical protein